MLDPRANPIELSAMFINVEPDIFKRTEWAIVAIEAKSSRNSFLKTESEIFNVSYTPKSNKNKSKSIDKSAKMQLFTLKLLLLLLVIMETAFPFEITFEKLQLLKVMLFEVSSLISS